MAKVLGVVIALVVVALGIFLIASSGNGDSNVTGNAVAGSENSVKTFVIGGGNFKFYMDEVENPELRVKQGDTVRVTFNNEEGFHDFVIDEFTGARTKQMQAGNSETIEFVADKAGSFEYYCSVGKHREMGMFGKFIVE
jgi:plastocyanin